MIRERRIPAVHGTVMICRLEVRRVAILPWILQGIHLGKSFNVTWYSGWTCRPGTKRRACPMVTGGGGALTRVESRQMCSRIRPNKVALIITWLSAQRRTNAFCHQPSHGGSNRGYVNKPRNCVMTIQQLAVWMMMRDRLHLSNHKWPIGLPPVCCDSVTQSDDFIPP